MHAVHVCSNDHGNNTYQVDQAGGSVGNRWLHRCSNCLLDCMYAIQRLLEVSFIPSYVIHKLTSDV
jgi:hypothetical protein